MEVFKRIISLFLSLYSLIHNNVYEGNTSVDYIQNYIEVIQSIDTSNLALGTISNSDEIKIYFCDVYGNDNLELILFVDRSMQNFDSISSVFSQQEDTIICVTEMMGDIGSKELQLKKYQNIDTQEICFTFVDNNNPNITYLWNSNKYVNSSLETKSVFNESKYAYGFGYFKINETVSGKTLYNNMKIAKKEHLYTDNLQMYIIPYILEDLGYQFDTSIKNPHGYIVTKEEYEKVYNQFYEQNVEIETNLQFYGSFTKKDLIVKN